MTIGPVSYTHLDVYKRQDIEWRSEGEPVHGGWPPVIGRDAGPGLVHETANWRVSAETVVHGHGPVSYTHLDVSKRQDVDCVR